MRVNVYSWGLLAGAALFGCQTSSVESISLIERTTVLAIQAEPAEAPPGTPVTFRALVVTGDGTLSTATTEWALCTHPRDVAENNSVAPECFDSDESDLIFVDEVRASEPALATIPDDACTVFGSEPQPAAPGESPTRPADPDSTGGYYVPIRASVLEEEEGGQQSILAVGHVRVRCALPSAPVDIARDYVTRYRNNENPVLEELSAVDSEGEQRSTYAPGETLELEARWPEEGVEQYVVYDAADRRLVDVGETLQVSWFVTGGSVTSDRTTASAGATQERVRWTAPPQPQDVQIWAVLRDDRGGMSWKQLSLSAE